MVLNRSITWWLRFNTRRGKSISGISVVAKFATTTSDAKLNNSNHIYLTRRCRGRSNGCRADKDISVKGAYGIGIPSGFYSP